MVTRDEFLPGICCLGDWISMGIQFELHCAYKHLLSKRFIDTPPKFNIAPKRWWLEDEFPFGIAYF